MDGFGVNQASRTGKFNFNLLCESRGSDAFFHQTNVVHHAKASIQNLEHLVDLHPALAVPVVEDCIAKLSVDEFRRVLENIPEPFRTTCIVAMCLGLRVSEILGLRWNDIDWEGLRLEVRQAYVYGKQGDVKTKASHRWMPLDRSLAERLRQHKASVAPLTFPGMLSTAGHWDQSSADIKDLLRSHRTPGRSRLKGGEKNSFLANLQVIVRNVGRGGGDRK
jgi:integrase